MRFFSRLGAGWNLGNTLDVHNLHYAAERPEEFETYWGNPRTTRQMIAEVRRAGFNTIRIPVTWYPHMDEAHQVDSAWMGRVRALVDAAMDEGLYVILNAHHDAWYTPAEGGEAEAAEIMEVLWTQICDAFSDCGERLIFEGMNEPRLIGSPYEWTAGTAEARAITNRLNRVFVETVRRSDAQNNAKRYLLIPTYCARTEEEALRGFELPEALRVGVSVHFYLPYAFAHDGGEDAAWSVKRPEDVQALDAAFEDLEAYFTRKNIPVVITEFGAVDKGNTGDRAAWAAYVTERAEALRIPRVWWDAGGREDEEALSFSIFDRRALTWRFPEILESLMGGR
ncbi:glycoside hydrolase family 5 protein [Oscillospiraceae bacterium OttesenSCG-928-F05]|nr:glycoside hydrolase family 5 protein [Oscillospiraceae bacterium OttesenSCG-928-F05]